MKNIRNKRVVKKTVGDLKKELKPYRDKVTVAIPDQYLKEYED